MNGNITPVMEHDIKEKFMSAYTSYYAGESRKKSKTVK